jgi:murein DD-endopeptidase MepM/ murein hydrolase activator NlpD
MRHVLAVAWLSAWAMSPAAPPADAVAIRADARSLQPGELVVLTMTTAEPADRVKLQVFTREIPVFRVDALTWRGLIGIDLDVRPGSYAATIEATDGERHVHATYALKVLPRRFPVRALKVDPALVTPPPEQEARVVREAAELEHLWRQSSPERLWHGPFVPPVASTAASRFGSRSIFNGQPRSPHAGADFPSPTGAPIAAPNAGRVVLARSMYFSGNTVILDHGLGLYSLLAHLSVIGVQEGDRVEAGQVIGKVGATGRVTGPHLHWGVRAGGARVDPLAVLAVIDREPPGR